MPSSPMLQIKKNGIVLRTLPIEQEMILGRDTACSIHLDDRAISRQHALLKLTEEGIQVEKQSAFGSLWINGQEVTHAFLKPGDHLGVGDYQIELLVPIPESFPEAKRFPQSETIPVGRSQLPHLVHGEKILSIDPAVSSGLIQPQEIQALEMPGQDASHSIEIAAGGELPASADLLSPSSDLKQPSENAIVSELSQVEGLEIASSGNELETVAPESQLEVEPSGFLESVDENEKTRLSSQFSLSAKLIFSPGTANVEEYGIKKDEVSIGRAQDCDIVLNDKKSSRKNTLIKRVGGQFYIQDLNSSNGTYVNGSSITEKSLESGDILQVGNTEFKFEAFNLSYKEKEKNLVSVPESAPVVSVELQNGPTPFVLENPSIVQNAQPMEMQIPGMSSLPVNQKKQTLIEKFRAQPPRRQIIIGAFILLLGSWLMEDEKKVVPNQKKVGVLPSPSVGPSTIMNRGIVEFENLTSDKKRFVESQHALAFDYYKNKEYDKAIFEIQKIFSILSDYKDAREIERYAKEGKRKIEAIEEEQRKKEAEEKIKIKIIQLLNETEKLMKKKAYEQAKEIFIEVLSLDPDNASIARWRKQIDDEEEAKRLELQQKSVQDQINRQAWKIYQEAVQLKGKARYRTAIATFRQAMDIGASDPRLVPRSKKMIHLCQEELETLKRPLLAQAAEAEKANDFEKSFAAYQEVIRVDSSDSEAHAGIERIRGILHERAKGIYIEAVLAESYSDFSTAKKKFQECLSVAPAGDIYSERASRKLIHYSIYTEETDQQ